MRAGLRRGELVALQWGDVQLGTGDHAARFILVQHNYVRREHTTTKSKKSRRVDLSRELRRVLVDLRDKRLLEASLKGKNDISDELVSASEQLLVRKAVETPVVARKFSKTLGQL